MSNTELNIKCDLKYKQHRVMDESDNLKGRRDTCDKHAAYNL